MPSHDTQVSKDRSTNSSSFDRSDGIHQDRRQRLCRGYGGTTQCRIPPRISDCLPRRSYDWHGPILGSDRTWQVPVWVRNKYSTEIISIDTNTMQHLRPSNLGVIPLEHASLPRSQSSLALWNGHLHLQLSQALYLPLLLDLCSRFTPTLASFDSCRFSYRIHSLCTTLPTSVTSNVFHRRT
jgi:hypothetical protein